MNEQLPPNDDEPDGPIDHGDGGDGVVAALSALLILGGLGIVAFGIRLMVTVTGDSSGVTPGSWLGGMVAFFGAAVVGVGMLMSASLPD